MKNNLLLFVFLIFSSALFAQDKMYIHKSDKVTVVSSISATDSVYFSDDNSMLNIKVGTSVAKYALSKIDSITFGDDSNTVLIKYDGATVSVVNPLAFEGVTVTVNNADVVVTSTSTMQDINYQLSGTSTDGSLKIYSDKSFNLLMNGVNITNADGPAINIQSKKKVSVGLMAGTTNSLTDGSTYTSSTEDQKGTFFSEGQLVFSGTGILNVKSNAKHGIACDDYINIAGGNITVSGAKTDGIHANQYIKMSDGTLNVTATSDAIDCEDGYIEISGGTITTTNASADVKAISCDSVLNITGGTITMNVSGNQSKALKSKKNINLTGGNITINASGSVALTASGSGYDASYCTAVKSDSSVIINGSTLTIKSTGVSGKGISAGKNIEMTSGTVNISTTGAGATYKNTSGVTDSYSASCLSSDVNTIIKGGTLTVSSSGSGGKGISSDGTITIGDANTSPTITITTTGSKFTVSGTDYCHPKALRATGAITINNGKITISSSDDGIHSDASITQNGGDITINNSVEGIESKYVTINGGSVWVNASDDGFNTTFSTVSGGTESNDGSLLTVNGGYVYASATSGDAIDSNGNILIAGGTVVANGPASQPNEAVDYNGSFTVTGGFLMGAGANSPMSKAMGSATTQYSLYLTSTSGISAGTMFHIQDASGTDIVSFTPARSAGVFFFSSSALKAGTYTIYTGGSSSGTAKDGLYTGGKYTAGTSKKSFTISSKVTSVSF